MLTTTFDPGAPNWLDLGARDIEAAAPFYNGLFGWTFQSAGPDAGGYGMFQLDGKTVAGLGPLTEEGANPAWTVYFMTQDADATVKAAEQAGGSVRFPAMDVFTAGRMAGFTDPAGAQFAVWEPREMKGLDVAGDPGSLCWVELHTSDSGVTRSFYGPVFDWNAQDMPMEGMTYTVLSASGKGADVGFGGVAQSRQPGEGSLWLPYFEVADCDASVARAQELGGRVTMPAASVEGVGRMAHLTDPAGAPFALITSASAAAA